MNTFLRKNISQVSRRFEVIETWLTASLVVFLVVFSLLQIILRNIFSTGIIWGDTLLRHIVLWVCLLGAARATADRKHIQIDLLSKLLPAGSARTLGIISNLFALAVSGLLFYASLAFIQNEMDSGITAFVGIPAWWLETAFPLGFALMAIRSAYQVVEESLAINGDLKQ